MKSKKTPAKKKSNPIKIEPDPWEKHTGDTPKSYEAFKIYRDMGPSRSFIKVAKELHVLEAAKTTSKPRQKQGKLSTRKRQIAKWSSLQKWVFRADAWDIEQDRIDRAEQRDSVREMKGRLAEQAMLVQTKGLQKIVDISYKDLTKKEALDFYSKGVEMEARFREVPDLKIEHSGEINTHETELDRMIASNPKTKAKINDILTELSTAESSGVRLSGK